MRIAHSYHKSYTNIGERKTTSAMLEAMDDKERLLYLLEAKKSAITGYTLSELATPPRKELESLDRKLETQAGMGKENRAAQKIIDKTPPPIIQENANLWRATLLIYGESPYEIFSRTKGMLYLAESPFNVGDTSPVFTPSSARRLLSIISHPFLNERPTSEALRLFLQFSVIASIGARTGWTPPFASGKYDCPVLDELRREMSLVSKNDHPTESIYEQFVRLTKSHPESVDTLILAEVGHFAHAMARGSNQNIQKRQKELYNREGVCAVPIDELIGVCLAIDNVASAKQEMSTERAREAFNRAYCRWLLISARKMSSVMKEVWRYESYLSYRSQQSQISAEETPQQCTDNIGTTPTPISAPGDLSEVHKPDQSNMAIECQTTEEVIAVDTDDVMNCCAAIDNAPRKSLAELWMDENPFEKPV